LRKEYMKKYKEIEKENLEKLKKKNRVIEE
jgi:hypothetical protein